MKPHEKFRARRPRLAAGLTFWPTKFRALFIFDFLTAQDTAIALLDRVRALVQMPQRID